MPPAALAAMKEVSGEAPWNVMQPRACFEANKLYADLRRLNSSYEALERQKTREAAKTGAKAEQVKAKIAAKITEKEAELLAASKKAQGMSHQPWPLSHQPWPLSHRRARSQALGETTLGHNAAMLRYTMSHLSRVRMAGPRLNQCDRLLAQCPLEDIFHIFGSPKSKGSLSFKLF